MAKMIEIDFHPSEATLRQFGWIALAGFGVLAALAWFEKLVFAGGLGEARLPLAAGLFGLGMLCLLLGQIRPQANRWLFVGLSLAAFPIGFVLSYVILTTLFFVVFAPIGIAMRLLGHDPMNRTLEAEATSYWTRARPTPPRDRYFKQF